MEDARRVQDPTGAGSWGDLRLCPRWWRRSSRPAEACYSWQKLKMIPIWNTRNRSVHQDPYLTRQLSKE
jgi:hypothetical protein